MVAVLKDRLENPFTERGRITDPRRFAARWRELSQIFERLEARRPVLVVGERGVGASSLLTHLAQAAGAVLERPELQAFYLDLALLPDAESCYRLINEALGSPGADPTTLELTLIEGGEPVLVCLDNVGAAIAAGWGAGLLERLARMARVGARAPVDFSESGGELLLVAASGQPPPRLSEPFALVPLGAFSLTDVRLLAEAYLENSGVSFTPTELRALHALSAGHPAYAQRAAYHLFRAHTEPDYDWRAAYLTESREQPVVGAPLPPAIFEGPAGAHERGLAMEVSGAPAPLPTYSAAGIGELALVMLPLIAGLLAFQLSGSWLIALLVFAVGVVIAVGLGRRAG